MQTVDNGQTCFLGTRVPAPRSRYAEMVEVFADVDNRHVQTGSIGINHHLPDPAAPFGGVKASGTGREISPGGLAHPLEIQSIYRPPSGA
jgi:acyl-CoA reductase-like NAD-dependent aldehyde dehydrogenase